MSILLRSRQSDRKRDSIMPSLRSPKARRAALVAHACPLLMAGVMFLSWSVCLNLTSAARRHSMPPVEPLFDSGYARQYPSSRSSDTSSLLPAGIAVDACGTPFINNIESFLDTCPSSDSATAQIRNDFQIRRNGILVGDILCSEPISQLPVSQYTDELIALQGLRVIYYMDRGRRGHLPWTPGSLYDWMKTKIGGIDIRDGSGSFCCESIDGKLYMAVGAQDLNRDFDRKWEGISGNINLYAHETRHVDGFFHTSCCGIAGGCDQTYDINNLSAYAIQWWLEKSWLMGDINVGFSCSSPGRIQAIINWHLNGANFGFRERFCDNKPPMLSPPPVPGGQCPGVAPDFSLSLSPETRTIPIGDSASFTVEVEDSPGSPSSAVHLCAIVMPPTEKIAVTISPEVVNASGRAILTASTMPDTPPGMYTITAGGTSGTHIHTRTVTVEGIATGPLIVSAEVKGKRLLITGHNFDDGATLLLDGERQKKTHNDELTPTTLLIASKSGKRIAPGRTVTLQVRNNDDRLSNQFLFTRPIQ